MYENFNFNDKVFLIGFYHTEKGKPFEAISDGVVSHVEKDNLIIVKGGLLPINFVGDEFGTDIYGNTYLVFDDEETAKKNLGILKKREELKKEISEMLGILSFENLQAIYSYIMAEKDKKGEKQKE